MNLMPCDLAGETLRVAGQHVRGAEALANKARALGTAELVLGVRPEFVKLVDAAAVPAGLRLEGTLVEVEERGAHRLAFVRVGEQKLALKSFDQRPLPLPGAPCLVELSEPRSLLYANGRAVP